jgi:DMSO/TMAO reductase YedYZ molybdopterin-dependent catalytic subunit
MTDLARFVEEHADLTRRWFLGLGAAGLAGLSTWPLWADAQTGSSEGDSPVSGTMRSMVARELGQSPELEYLSSPERFYMFGRGNPPPYQLPPEKRREVGLEKETWQLEVVPDPASDCKVERPLSKALGTTLTWDGLMKLAEKRAVRFLKVMTCTNGADPFGMGLWEGVPLREVIWLARPTGNLRRVFYWGYHNDDPAQRFQSSLPIGRVLEDPPGEQPVILCYKLNGQWLSPKAGAPVRMIVPDAYGNKSVKWLQHVVLTNNHQPNDTYAQWNNDTESPLKTYARFLYVPETAKASQPIAITGVAQVGPAGLSKVQYWLCPQDATLPPDDPYFTKGDWKDAAVLPPPEHWGGGLPEGKLPPIREQIDADGKPLTWPLRNALVHWAALITGIAPGRYHLRCRTIDSSGVAQPMPRPFPKSGANGIQEKELVVEG